MKIPWLYGLIIIINSPIVSATGNPDNFLGPRDIPDIKSSIENYFRQGDGDFHYGNWYGSEIGTDTPDTRLSGNKTPVDSLDYIAQKHDFAYQIAEQQGKLNGMAEEKRLKGIADYLMIRDAKMLPENPKQWAKPPADISRATHYRERMIAGFTEQTVTKDTVAITDTSPNWATSPIENLKLEKSRQLNTEDFEKLVTHLQNTWNGEDSTATPNKPLVAVDDNTNKTVQQKSASHKKTAIVPDSNTEPKETHTQAEFIGNRLGYYLKALTFRVSALSTTTLNIIRQ
jgi:hypothetical protein